MDGTPSEKRGGAPAGLRRLRGDEPSKAITSAAVSEFLNPFEDRYLTVRECARLQTFPDAFRFAGTLSEKATLIGNAVPPMLAHALANSIVHSLTSAPLKTTSSGRLLSFVPTLSSGMSPALQNVMSRVRRRYLHEGNEPERAYAQARVRCLARAKERLFSALVPSELADKASRSPTRCVALLAITLADLGHEDAVPNTARSLPRFFQAHPVNSLRVEGIELESFYETALAADPDVDTYFLCLARLHKSRKKYERIVATQPLATMDQVGPRVSYSSDHYRTGNWPLTCVAKMAL